VKGSIVPRILNLTLNGGECSVSRFGRFTLGKLSTGTHRIEGWDGGGGWTLCSKAKPRVTNFWDSLM
jgi:hypothetical protein